MRELGRSKEEATKDPGRKLKAGSLSRGGRQEAREKRKKNL